MPRRRAAPPIPDRDSVPDMIRRLRALDVYKTGNSLACKAADALEWQAAEIERQAAAIKAWQAAYEEGPA